MNLYTDPKKSEKFNTLLGEIEQNKELYSSYNKSCEKLTWCGGCGNFQIQNALQIALATEKIPVEDVLLCFDVGCNGNGSDKMHSYTIHGLHGRVISLAAGAALANPNLKVIASAGDGATFSEGIGHVIHGIRSNYPMLFILHNNYNYGLTTGQPSATTKPGHKMNSAPDGVYVPDLNPLEILLALEPSFIARSFSGDLEHMVSMMRQGLNHNGFAIIEVMQSCPTYNRSTPQKWYWDRIHYLEEDNSYDNSDIWAARKMASDIDQKIAVGLLYHKPSMPSYLDALPNRQNIKSAAVDEVDHFDISELLKEFE